MPKNAAKKLRIALFCSTLFQTPPENKRIIHAPLYLVQFLAEQLQERGHLVTLYATVGSRANVPIRSAGIKSLSKNEYFMWLKRKKAEAQYRRLMLQYDQRMLSEIYEHADEFDIVHIHHLNPAIAFANLIKKPATLLTYHSPYFEYEQEVLSLYKKQAHIHIRSLSKSHAKNIPDNFKKHVVYNGLKIDGYRFSEHADGHLIFAGRLVPEKGPDIAIQVARKLKLPLRIAGKRFYDKKYNIFWNKKIRPYLGKKIRHIGMTPFRQVPSLYQNAKALLFPVRWEEPFGLVLIESMACGAPVVAFGHGSVPEIVVNGKTGYIVHSEREMVQAVKKIYAMPQDEYLAMRRACRKHVEERFSLIQMVDEYEKIYRKIII